MARKDVFNDLQQPVGFPVPDWKAPPRPARDVLTGRFCRLEPLQAGRHASDLFEADKRDVEGGSWTYLPYGPFESLEDYLVWMRGSSTGDDPLFFAIVDNRSDRAVGVASYLRINPAAGSIEVGHIHYSPELQRNPAATEAMFLMMKNAFDIGYRRYEWKCDALNAASRSAAQRLGFTYEGVFRQATIYRQRNRDTAWFAVIDAEWPALCAAFSQWLAAENFDEHGQQQTRLSELTRSALAGARS